MKINLGPHDERLYKLAIRDLEKSLRGEKSSYTRVDLPVPATTKEVKAARKAVFATNGGAAFGVKGCGMVVRRCRTGGLSSERARQKHGRKVVEDRSRRVVLALTLTSHERRSPG